jgi:selenide,water dikinase
MTDITGFGLLGHLIEMAETSGLSAELYYSLIGILAVATDYLAQRIVPDATYRNWNSYSTKVIFEKGINVMEAFSILPDPQTNGGLMVAVNPAAVTEVQELLKDQDLGMHTVPVGRFIKKDEKVVSVKA